MTKLNVGGTMVNVDDSFLKQSPEDQEATVQDIARQLGIGAQAAPAAPAPGAAYDPNDPRFRPGAMETKQVVRGIPILGPALGERASAGMSALANPLTGAGSAGPSISERYAKNLAQEAAARQAYEAAHPVRSMALQGLGGTAALAAGGMIPELAVAGRTIPSGARMLGLVGPARTAIPAAAASGAAIGAADASARGEGPVQGALTGALTGAGGVVAGKTAGRVWDAARGLWVDRPRIPNALNVAGVDVPVRESVVTRDPATAAEEQGMLGTQVPTAVEAEQQTNAAMQQAHANLSAHLDPTGQSAGATPLEAGDAAVRDLADQERQRDLVEQARVQAANDVTRILSGGQPGGAGPASTSDVGTTIGQRIRDLFTGARQATRAAYGAAANVPATYNPRYMINAGNTIREALNNLPGDQRVRINANVTPQAQAALDTIDQEISQLRFTNDAARGQRPITPADMDQVRKALVIQRRLANNAARMTGNWEDARAVGRVMDAFDAWQQATATRPGGLLTGDPADVLATGQAARAAHAQERATFSRRGPGDVVGQFMENVVGKYPGQEMSPEKIVRSIMGTPDNPAASESAVPILNHLRDNVFGANSPEWAAIKRAVVSHLTEAPAGAEPVPLARQAERIERFLANDRHAGALFDAPEQAVMQQHAANLRGAEDIAPARGTIEHKIAQLSGRLTGEPASSTTIISELMGANGAKLAAGLRNQLSPEAWAQVRQGIFKKISAAPEGGIPWGDQKTGQQIAKFLNSELAREMYSPNERTMMKAIADAHLQLVPLPRTTNVSGSGYEVRRFAKGLTKQFLRMVGVATHGLPGLAGAEVAARGVDRFGQWQQGQRAADLFLGKRIPLPRTGARVPPAVGAFVGQIPSFRNQPAEQ